MNGLRGGGGVSGGLLPGFLPVERRQLIQPILIGHPRQALQHVVQKYPLHLELFYQSRPVTITKVNCILNWNEVSL